MQADPLTITRLLKTAQGQLEGILKMIEEGRCCLDISGQIMAAAMSLSSVSVVTNALRLDTLRP